jgi:hypothetical protein
MFHAQDISDTNERLVHAELACCYYVCYEGKEARSITFTHHNAISDKALIFSNLFDRIEHIKRFHKFRHGNIFFIERGIF